MYRAHWIKIAPRLFPMLHQLELNIDMVLLFAIKILHAQLHFKTVQFSSLAVCQWAKRTAMCNLQMALHGWKHKANMQHARRTWVACCIPPACATSNANSDEWQFVSTYLYSERFFSHITTFILSVTYFVLHFLMQSIKVHTNNYDCNENCDRGKIKARIICLIHTPINSRSLREAIKLFNVNLHCIGDLKSKLNWICIWKGMISKEF